MKCPDCKVDMDEGSLNNQGMVWTKRAVEVAPSFLKWMTAGDTVAAYCCPNCQKIELKLKK